MNRFAVPYKWQLIGMLWVTYFLNQGDRQIFNVIIPLIKADMLTDVEIGLVATISTLVYGILVPVVGFAGDLLKGVEAFYYPAATSLIGQFHQKTLAMALSIHQTSLYFGIVASGFLAGYIWENYGWRMGLFSFGVVDVLWAILALKCKQVRMEVSVMLAFAFFIGSLAPVILGWVKTVAGLEIGLASLSLFYLTGGILIFIELELFFKQNYYEETHL